MKNFLMAIFAFAFCSSALAAVSVPPGAKAVIQKNWPKASIEQMTASGDIDGDDIADFAAVIKYPGESEDLEKVVVLKGVKGGAFSLLAQSKEFYQPRKGDPALEIKKSALLVKVFDATCCVGSSMSFRFMYRDGRFVLVGFDGNETDTEHGKWDANVSLNLITGDRIEMRRVGAQKKEIKTKVQARRLVAFEDSDMSMSDDLLKEAEFLIDENLNVRRSVEDK